MMTEEHFDPDSFRKFIATLDCAGFKQVGGSTSRPVMRGPIHSAFQGLTDATTMDVAITAGWPIYPPMVFVNGLHTNHLTPGGFVCLWQEGDYVPDEWVAVEALYSRIEEWCEYAKQGWENNDLGEDAILNFEPKLANVATFDWNELDVSKGGWGEFHALFNTHSLSIDILPGRKKSEGQLRALWFHAGELTVPSRNLDEVPSYLSKAQSKGLKRALDGRQIAGLFRASLGADLILFCWDRQGKPNLLVIACEGTGKEVTGKALQPGPNDEESLILRAGPDSDILRKCKAVMFGAGALGGHCATLLAESGICSLDIIDPDVLLPGNVVRHVAGHKYVGTQKTHAVREIIEEHAPWTDVECFQSSPRTPTEMLARIADADVVIDTTGSDSLITSLAVMTGKAGKPLVSGALYRGGSVGRVRRQVPSKDTSLFDRLDCATRYPKIPAARDQDIAKEIAVPQLGCSAPIHNAPPSAVVSCASLISQIAIDVLTERFRFADDVVDVYRAIQEYPFDREGRYEFSRQYQRV